MINHATDDLLAHLEERLKQYGSDEDLSLIPAGDRHKQTRDILLAVKAQLLAGREAVKALERIADLDKHGGYNTACDISRKAIAAAREAGIV